MLDRLAHTGAGGLAERVDVASRLLAAAGDEHIGTGADIGLAGTDGGALGAQRLVAATGLGRLAGLPAGAGLGGGILTNGVGLSLGISDFCNGFLGQDHTFFLSNAVAGVQAPRA